MKGWWKASPLKMAHAHSQVVSRFTSSSSSFWLLRSSLRLSLTSRGGFFFPFRLGFPTVSNIAPSPRWMAQRRNCVFPPNRVGRKKGKEKNLLLLLPFLPPLKRRRRTRKWRAHWIKPIQSSCPPFYIRRRLSLSLLVQSVDCSARPPSSLLDPTRGSFRHDPPPFFKRK